MLRDILVIENIFGYNLGETFAETVTQKPPGGDLGSLLRRVGYPVKSTLPRPSGSSLV